MTDRPAPSARFTMNEIVVARGGGFSFELCIADADVDAFLVLDLYDLDNPAHPEGHFGWRRYDLKQLPQRVDGALTLDDDGGPRPTISGVAPVEEWWNPDKVSATRMELLVVLRSAVSNAILSIDRVPATMTEHEMETFRSGFDRNFDAPRFLAGDVALPAGTSVHIVAGNIFQRDAVGNLCLALYRMLGQRGVPVRLFAGHFDLAMNDVIAHRSALASSVMPGDVIVYFYSIHDDALDDVLAIACRRRIGYFHGVTPPQLLRVFDPELGALCARAMDQLPQLARFDRLAANSRVSAGVLHEALRTGGVEAPPRIDVIVPKILDEKELIAAAFAPPARAVVLPPTLLYVGRIKSHKRIEDLLRLYKEYRVIDPAARCTIVGLADTPAYTDYLHWVQVKQLGLAEDAIEWRGSVSDDELEALYAAATVYVSMSEHEGFALPVLEAMLRGVLVFAYGEPAVRETLGHAGVVFDRKSFPDLARQLHQLLTSPEAYARLTEAQRLRARDLASQMDGGRFLELLTGGAVDHVAADRQPRPDSPDGAV